MPENTNGNGNAADGPPPPGTNSGVSRQESRTASGRVLGAAELALHRCRELAGVRIRQKCADCGDGEPLSVVASAVTLTEDPLKLVKGATDGFRDFLVEQGWDTTQAIALCGQLEVFAASTLTSPRCPDLPPGFAAAILTAQEVTRAVAR